MASPAAAAFRCSKPSLRGGSPAPGLRSKPDDAVPRFNYEGHVRTLIDERRWPNSTVDISELRLVIDYQRHNGADRTLTLDIVDYPGEWLLDLPLLNKTYDQWSKEALALSARSTRATGSRPRGTRIWQRLMPRDPLTNRLHSHRRGCSRTICAPAAMNVLQ